MNMLREELILCRFLYSLVAKVLDNDIVKNEFEL